MEVLKVILTIIGMVAYATLGIFAVTSWFRLREVERKMRAALHDIRIVATMTMGRHVKESFDDVNRLKRTFERLVENEQYEDAKQLKAVIDKAEQDANRSLEKFKEMFGDNVEVTVTKVDWDATVS